MYHCLFEQSGTFKNEFKKLGYEAQDYDIRNDFNETDNVVDLYDQILVEYDNLHNEREREDNFWRNKRRWISNCFLSLHTIWKSSTITI